jgi:shikimate dehydrogenase
MDRYVVIGNPVSHSLSPAIHARFAEQTGDRIEYSALLAPLDGFRATARRFFESGGRGANVTLPFKVEAFALADDAGARAREAGAANFLMRFDDGRIHADNTDGAGLVADLRGNLRVALRGARILLLGAGGAARGVLGPLLAEAPRGVVIANRTPERARELAARFAAQGSLEACALDAIPGGVFDVVLNATSTSTHGEALAIPASVFGTGTLAYDMAYGHAADEFLAGARARSARTSDGLGMVVEQAAESWLLWRGRRPATAPVLAALRAGLS